MYFQHADVNLVSIQGNGTIFNGISTGFFKVENMHSDTAAD